MTDVLYGDTIYADGRRPTSILGTPGIAKILQDAWPPVKEVDTRPDSQALIREVCDEIRDFLIEKNEQYGDSAINPVRIFSKAGPVEQLLVRIDDKLNRIMKGDDRLESDDDVTDDLIGYLVLLKVAKRSAGE